MSHLNESSKIAEIWLDDVYVIFPQFWFLKVQFPLFLASFKHCEYFKNGVVEKRVATKEFSMHGGTEMQQRLSI